MKIRKTLSSKNSIHYLARQLTRQKAFAKKLMAMTFSESYTVEEFIRMMEERLAVKGEE